MESYALLVAATLNAGTVLALAALGLLINEKAGVLNLGAEGMMLCAAIAGFAAVVHTGNDWIGFAAGMGAGAVLAAIFGVLVIWLGTNQYATGLALSLFGAGFSAFAGIAYVQEKVPERASYAVPWLADIPLLGPALFRQHPLVYVTIALVAGLIWFLYRSRAGLVLRSVGESPESAHALGYKVRWIRLGAVVAAPGEVREPQLAALLGEAGGADGDRGRGLRRRLAAVGYKLVLDGLAFGERAEAGALHDRLVHGRHRRVPGGPCLFQPAKEFQGIEATGAIYLTALRQGRQDTRNESVNVKQGHHIQAAICAAKACAGGNVLCRGTHIAMGQGHNFGSRSCARSVKHQGHIVGLCITRMLSCFVGKAVHVQCERASAQVGGRLEFNQRNAHFGCHGNRWTGGAFFNHQSLGIQVVEIKLKLICAVTRVQWG